MGAAGSLHVWLLEGEMWLFTSFLMLDRGKGKGCGHPSPRSPDGYGYAAYQPLAGQPQHNQHRVATSH